MGKYVGSIAGIGVQTPMKYFVSENINEGQVVMAEDTATEPGEVELADAVTAALNALGCAFDSAVYTTTQGDPAAQVSLIQDPWAIWEFLASGGATAGTALGTGTPGNVLTNTAASAGGTLITSANVGTINMAGGLVLGRTGANQGQIRKLSAHTDNTSTAVTVPFPNAIAVGDTFIRVPWSKAVLAMQLTSNFAQANAVIASGTGVPVQIHKVHFDDFQIKGLDAARVLAIFRTHLMNSLA